MLQVSNLNKAYGSQVIFRDVSFTVGRGERVGLVGRNGSGKTTLFRLILGEEQPDSGAIIMPKQYHCGHLAQHLKFTESSIVKEACRGLRAEEREQEYKAEIILSGLGFSKEQLQLPAAQLSGGFQIRVELARVLLSEPDLLLLDEPTNYLDIVSLRWLERFLRSWKREVLLISHDRGFIDSVSTHALMIRRCSMRKMEGSATKLYEQVAVEEALYEQTRLNTEAKKRDIEVFINRFRYNANKASQVQSRIKAIERMGNSEKLEEESCFDFTFRERPFPGKTLVEAQDICFDYNPAGADAAGKYLINGLSLCIGKNDRIGVIGKNGQGKSTLLRLLAAELEPLGGSIRTSPNAAIGYFGQTNIQRLTPSCTVEQEIFACNEALTRTQVRNICGTMMFDGELALKTVAVLSGGEKSRVLLGKLLAQPSNLLLLDEPSNHLDLESVAALIESLRDYQGALVIVTHDEHILRALATRLIVFQQDGPQLLEGGYDYFLEKLGWEEEREDRPSQAANTAVEPPVKSAVSPAVKKRQRAELIQAKSAKLRPLEREIDALENRICALEEEVKSGDQELIRAAQIGNGEEIAALSRRLADARAEIEESFEKLNRTVSNYDQLTTDFDLQLKQIES